MGKVAGLSALAERVAKWAERGSPVDDLPWKNRQEFYATLQERPELLTVDFPESYLPEKGITGNSLVERALRDHGVGLRHEREGADRAGPNSHWDPIGGGQAAHRAWSEPEFMGGDSDLASMGDSEIWDGAQLRFAPLRGLKSGRVLDHDPNDGYRVIRDLGNTLYPNEFEGARADNPILSRGKSFVELLNDPDALARGNYSLTMPFSSPTYRNGRVLKAGGGSVGNSNRAPEEEERRRLQAQLLALPGNAWDAGAGALRGAVGATLGVGGDLERLIRAGYGALTAPSGQRLESALGGLGSDTLLPNSEEMLHGDKWFSLPPGTDTPSFEAGQGVGEWLPITPKVASSVARSTLQAAKRGVQGVGGLAAEAARRGVEQGRGPLGALSLVAQPHYAVPRLYQAPNGAAVHFDEGYHTLDEMMGKLQSEGGMGEKEASASAFHLVQGARRRQGYAHGGSVTAYTPPAQPTFRQQLLARLEG